MDPAQRATQAAERAEVEVRRLHTLGEAIDAVEVSRATWGDHNVVPPEVFRAFQESGNLLQGAFRDTELIGIAVGWFGRDDDGWHLHSHQLAVLDQLRSSGIGYALKLAQRAETLGLGLDRIRWTFDPMQSRNAYFNLAKLGAHADAFHRNFYGEMPDEINSGDRSDRLVIRWDIEVEPPDATDPDAGGEGAAADDAIPIPEDFASLKLASPEEAAHWRERTAAALESAFAADVEVVGFARGSGYSVGPKGSA